MVRAHHLPDRAALHDVAERHRRDVGPRVAHPPPHVGSRRDTPPGRGTLPRPAPGRETRPAGSRCPSGSRPGGWPAGPGGASSGSRCRSLATPSPGVKAGGLGPARSRAGAQPPRGASRGGDPAAAPRSGPGPRDARWPRAPSAPRRRGPAPGPSAGDEGAELVARRPVPERRPEVHASLRVKAQVPGAVGGEPAPVAGPAEGRRGRGDDAERRAVRETEPLGRRGRLLANRLDRPVPLGQCRGSPPGRRPVPRPVGPPAHVHVLDERTSASTPRPNHEVDELVLVTPRMTTVSSFSPGTRPPGRPRSRGGRRRDRPAA